MDYSKFISQMSQNRKASGFSEMESFLKNASPSLVYLATGQPNPDFFPFKDATITLQSGGSIKVTPEVMTKCLQYGAPTGYKPLVDQLKKLTRKEHNPPRWEERDVIVTMGVQDGLSKAFEMLMDFGDYVVVEEPCYADTLCILSAVAPKYLKVDTDEGGMRPDSLRKVLEDVTKKDPNRRPKVMFVVPNASNPCGTTLDEARRREIYAIASEYNLIIMEDDPYYHLQFLDQKKLAPSFLELDTDGRVLRFDSFSKTVSSGLRVGWVTGHKYLLERMLVHMEASTLCPPGISQVMMSELLNDWGEEGFYNQVAKERKYYQAQRDALLLAANTHLKGLCEWTVPSGGLFVWFKVAGVKDTLPMLQKSAVERDVMLSPGKDFMLDSTKPCQYMRACYTIATPAEMMSGIKNLADAIKEELALQK